MEDNEAMEIDEPNRIVTWIFIWLPVATICIEKHSSFDFVMLTPHGRGSSSLSGSFIEHVLTQQRLRVAMCIWSAGKLNLPSVYINLQLHRKTPKTYLCTYNSVDLFDVCKFLNELTVQCWDFCSGFFCPFLLFVAFDSRHCMLLNLKEFDYFIGLETFSRVVEDVGFKFVFCTDLSKMNRRRN